MLAKFTAQRRYFLRLAVIMALYCAAIFVAVTLRKDAATPPALMAAVALVPGICIIGVFWAIGRLIVEEPDEFLRMLIIRQALIATAFALSLASIHGFLSQFQLVDRVDAYWVAVLWCFGLAVGQVINRIQYGTWGKCL